MNKKDLCKIVGKNIQRERLEQGFTQESFAELMNVSWSYVSKIESGVINLSLGKILELAEYLQIDVDKLLQLRK